MSKSSQELMLNALKEIKVLKRQLAGYKKAAHEPIAVVGMSCRLPGSSSSPQQFWDNLVAGKDCITQMESDERWRLDDIYDPDPDAPGKVYSKGLGIIDGIGEFDADFFGISKREAVEIDPQHRLLLEVCHDALEHAGYPPGRLSGTKTGVYVGIASADYAHLGSMLGVPEKLTPWQGIGNALSAAPGRISYLFNLKGPAVSFDTACSSTLTALHYACQGLRNRESDTAILGGVHLLLNPAVSIVFAKARMLATDGLCKTFDAAADGYVRSEGCGVLVLKRLSDAQAAGDNILGVIRATALSQDGKSQGFAAPNETAQEAVIRDAVERAEIDPRSVSYVEAHGTGTPLGDPIELSALNTVYCEGQQRKHPLLVGSAKTNVGHGEAVAGIAGLVKLVESLRHKTIPPHIHFNKPNPYIPWNKMAIQITKELTNWEDYRDQDQPLRAGLSGFAFTGTNVHVIMEEYQPPAKAIDEEKPAATVWVPSLVLGSAKTEPALAAWKERLATYLSANPDTDYQRLVRTLTVGRDHYKFRQAFLAQNNADLITQLNGAGKALTGIAKKSGNKVAFLFSGVGAEYQAMAQTMYQQIPLFQQHLDAVAKAMAPTLDVELTDLLWGDKSAELSQIQWAEPALFAVEYAMAKTWMDWGLKPDCLVGSGLGELTAACIAGVFNLADGCALVTKRSQLLASLGSASASQSTAVEPILDDYRKLLSSIKLASPRMRLLSNLDGQHAGRAMTDADYWCRQLSEPVNFAACIEGLQAAEIDLAIEVGPGNGMALEAKELASGQLNIFSSYAKGAELDGLTQAMAELYVAGQGLLWGKILPQTELSMVPVPTYPFQHKPYWNEVLVNYMERDQLPEHTKDWCYQVQWQALSEVPATASLEGRWMLLDSHQDSALAQAMVEHNTDLAVLQFALNDAGIELQGNGQTETLSNTSASSNLLQQLLEASEAEPLNLVFSTVGMPALAAAEHWQSLTNLVLLLAKSVQQAEGVALWIITEGADGQRSSVDSDAGVTTKPEQAVVLGFAKNLIYELAGKMRGVLDLAQADQANIQQALKSLHPGSSQPWLQLNQGQTYHPVLARAANKLPVNGESVAIEADKMYVIAGGTGALGIALAIWLGRKGAKNIALLSRNGVTESVDFHVQKFIQGGINVQVPAVDISNRDALADTLNQLRRQAPIGGVIHAAGLFEINTIEHLSSDQCMAVMDSKVLGMQWLDELTQDDPLDFFVGYSSIASVWGSAGNFHYSAANQVVDAIIQRRRQQGKPGLAINWGPWEDSGMVDDSSKEQAAKRGLQLMDKGTGTRLFGQILAGDLGQMVVADVNWRPFHGVMELLSMGSMFADLVDTSEGAAEDANDVALTEEDLSFKASLAQCAPEERAEKLLLYLKTQLARALHGEPEDIDETQPLIEMGIDSLLAVEFKNRAVKVTEVDLPVSRMLSGASLKDVSQWLAEGYQEMEAGADGSDEDDDLVEGVL